MSEAEQILRGGNVADRVVRIGNTVRKPATPGTRGVEAFLEHLHHSGFEAAPRTLGRDEQGRHVLEYIPGETIDPASPLSESELSRVGGLIRKLHLAAESFMPPEGARWTVAIPPDSESLICHNDLAPWNLVRHGERLVFIDWDGSGPGSVMWDVAYAAQSFVPLAECGDVVLQARRLRAFADGYGLDRLQREALPRHMVERTLAMHRLLERGAQTGEQPWGRLHAEGHAVYWERSAAYVQMHLAIWRQALLSGAED